MHGERRRLSLIAPIYGVFIVLAAEACGGHAVTTAAPDTPTSFTSSAPRFLTGAFTATLPSPWLILDGKGIDTVRLNLQTDGAQVKGTWGGGFGGSVSGQVDGGGAGASDFGHLELQLRSSDFDWRVEATVTREDGSQFSGKLLDYDFTDAPVRETPVTFLRLASARR